MGNEYGNHEVDPEWMKQGRKALARGNLDEILSAIPALGII